MLLSSVDYAVASETAPCRDSIPTKTASEPLPRAPLRILSPTARFLSIARFASSMSLASRAPSWPPCGDLRERASGVRNAIRRTDTDDLRRHDGAALTPRRQS